VITAIGSRAAMEKFTAMGNPCLGLNGGLAFKHNDGDGKNRHRRHLGGAPWLRQQVAPRA